MKLGSFAPILEALYTDKMDVYRMVEKDNEDGTEAMVFPDMPIYSNISCRISFEYFDKPGDQEVDNNPIKFNPKVFCSRKVDIVTGDTVEVRRMDDDKVTVLQTYKGRLGMPARFPTHQEALFYINESA